jgi:hypothetical protein
MEEQPKQPSAAARVSTKRKRSMEVFARDHTDLHNSLEHLIAVGLKEQRESERYRAYCSILVSDARQSLIREQDEVKGGKSIMVKEAFVEDIRLYTAECSNVKFDGLEGDPWPKKRLHSAKTGTALAQVVNHMDQNWDLEYGDSIHPLAFSAARLSSKEMILTRSPKELMLINGSNLNVATTETSLPENDVPRALLIRCWERAVDAASQTISAQVRSDTVGVAQRDTNDATARPAAIGLTPTDYQDVTSSYLFGGSILGLGNPETGFMPILPRPISVKEPAFAAAQRALAWDSSATKIKCTSLGLGLTRSQLPPDVSLTTCPACYRQFEQLKMLHEHYYGHCDQRGCCWRRIAQKEPRIVASMLEGLVKSQIDQYLGLIMDHALVALTRDGGIEPVTRKQWRRFNWHDVLKFTEEAISTSHCIDESKSDPCSGIHPIFETFQRKPNCDPLVLNPTILMTARKRLLDRYANVPR